VIIHANSNLRLVGGSFAVPNTMDGATFTGLGLLRHTASNTLTLENAED